MLDWILRRWYDRTGSGTRVRSVYAFHAGEDPYCIPLAWDPNVFRGDGWERHVRDAFGLSDFRVEIRLQEGPQKKRRVVLYPGDACDPEFPRPPRCVVINARLMPKPDGGAEPVDVTARVQKYVGNALKNIHHMFPFDDPHDNADRFTHLRIIDLEMTLTDVPM